MAQALRGYEGLVVVAAAAAGALLLVGVDYLVWVARRGGPLPAAWQRVTGLASGMLLLAVLGLLLYPQFGPSTLNLVPGRDLFAAADVHVALANLVGNIALFVPLGMLAPECVSALRRPAVLLAAGLAVSGGVEAAQYLLHLGRSADVTDVLLNVAGLLLGGLVNRYLVRRFAVWLHGGYGTTPTPAG